MSHVLHGKDGVSDFTHSYGQRIHQGSAKNSWKEPTRAQPHSQATPSMHHTHTHPHPQIDVVTFSLPLLDSVGHTQIDDSKDFHASESGGQKQETVLLSTSWLCTWTFLYFPTDRSRLISVCGQNSWHTASCSTTQMLGEKKQSILIVVHINWKQFVSFC